MNSVSRLFCARSAQAVFSLTFTIPAAAGILWWLTTSWQPEATEDFNAQVPGESFPDHTEVPPEVIVRPAAQPRVETSGQTFVTVFIVESDEAADRLRVSLQEGHAPTAWMTGSPALGEILAAEGREHADHVASTLAECERLLAGLNVPRVRFVQVTSD